MPLNIIFSVIPKHLNLTISFLSQDSKKRDIRYHVSAFLFKGHEVKNLVATPRALIEVFVQSFKEGQNAGLIFL